MSAVTASSLAQATRDGHEARSLDHSEGVRILLVTPGLGLGGSERLTLAYARGLSARGHAALIAYGPPDRLGTAADEAGVARRLVSERRLGARTLPEWLR